MSRSRSIPWLCWPLLLGPRRIGRALDQIDEAGLVSRTPTVWQVAVGVLRMWHRVVFRPETIGTCSDFSPRTTWRARLLHNRILRGPFLFVESAIAPWDHSGLLSSPDRVRKHLLCAHHDGVQFAYDFELLMRCPGALEAVRDEARAVVEGSHPRATWYRDLCVYERYHEELLAAAERFLAGDELLTPAERADPDISFRGFLDWCAQQPARPRDLWALIRQRRFRFPAGLIETAPLEPAP